MKGVVPHFLRLLCVAAATAASVSSPSALAADRSDLDAANRRWRGARCRTRMEITVKKGVDGDGWSRSKYLWWDREKKSGNHRVLVLFTRSDAIRSRYRGGEVPIGVELVAVGWATDDEKGGDLFLELEHPEIGARVRVYYYDAWVGRVSASRLPEFERWARLEFLEMVSTPEEQLVDVPAPPPVAAPPVAIASPPAARPPVEASGAFDVRVLAASVEPARVPPGSEAGFQIVYSVSGLAPGSETIVAEERVVTRDGTVLTTLRAKARRAAGVHQSTQKLRLPSDLVPGVYELQARVSAGGQTATGTAMFQVQAPGSP